MAEGSNSAISRSTSKCSSRSSTSEPGSPRIYSQMLHELQKTLGMSEMLELALLADIDVATESEMNLCTSAASRFRILKSEMEKKNLLGEKNVDFLKDALKRMGHERGMKLVTEYEDTEIFAHIPSFPESSEDESETDSDSMNSFEDYLKVVGLSERLRNHLTLWDVTVVRETSLDGPVTELPFILLKKLTSFDYRALLPETYNKRVSSIRDFLYAILTCSDNFLTQYIFEKLSICQLAVPILLPPSSKDDRPTLMLFAVRGVIKEWKTKESVFLEKRISNWPTFTVAFVRIGEIPLSKSILINNMLGRSQGNRGHPYFLSKKDDNLKDATFSKGTVECLWYLPPSEHQAHPGESVEQIATTVLNLRGDIVKFPYQSRLISSMANLVIAIIDSEKSKDMKRIITDLEDNCKNVLFVCLKQVNDNKQHDPKREGKWLFHKVKEGDEEISLSKFLWEVIERSCQEKDNTRITLEKFAESAEEEDVLVDISKCKDTKRVVEDLFLTDSELDLADFKDKHLPLQKLFCDWVQCDKRRLEAENFAEIQMEEIRREKKQKRLQQREKGLSDKLRTFWNNLEGILTDDVRFRYFFIFFREFVNEMAIKSIRPHLKEMTRLEEELRRLQSKSTVAKKAKKGKRTPGKGTSEVERVKELLYAESRKYSTKYIGYEHFLREIGQLYESYVNGSNKCPTHLHIHKIPHIVAKMILAGYPFEVLDGDSTYVPIQWVSHVLRILSKELNNPKLLVVSVIGIQSSGKSTLLNAMFGVRFPVRAGRCTRGLFLQLLPVEETYSSKLGYKYLVLIDTEGLRSPDRALFNKYNFDNALATLALCLADLNIINIQGEVISQDMVGILQIAVHALIRMKRVNLKSHCQIVQQRISDPTAVHRNKANVNKLLEVLDNATRIAASEEDVADQYTQFSDIFPFAPESDIIHVPCLWTGQMSPPNHNYSETVTELASTISTVFSNQTSRIKPQFTVDDFIVRLRDVWKAIKEEDFVFNFQNSLRALSYSSFRFEFHKWTCDLRQSILKWEVEECGVGVKVEESVASLDKKLETHSNEVKKEIDKYIKSHRNEEELAIHENEFKVEVDIIANDIKSEILKKMENVAKEHLSVSEVIEDFKAKLREMAREKARVLREDKKKSTSEVEIKKIFKQCWTGCLKQIEEHDLACKKPTTETQKICETSLMKLSSNTALSLRIRELKESEGDIGHHKRDFKFEKYIESKTPETEIRRIECEVKKVIKDCLKNRRDTLFNENLLHICLSNAIKQLQLGDQRRPKIPKLLAAKTLLHICGKISDTWTVNQRTLGDLVAKEEDKLFNDFRAFLDVSVQCENTSSRVLDCFVHIFKEIVMKKLNLKVLEDMRHIDHFIDKERLIARILSDLAKGKDYKQYIDFVTDEEGFIKQWVKRKVMERCYGEDGARLLDLASETVESLVSSVEEICNNLNKQHPKSGQFCEWLEGFQAAFYARHKYNDTALNGLKSFDVVINFDEFTSRLFSLLREDKFEEIVIKTVKLPFIAEGEEGAKRFLEAMARAPHLEIVKQFKSCDAKCPFCKVVCHLQEKGHKHHSAVLHYPQGIAGCQFTLSKKLVLDMCTTSVASENHYRFGEKEDHRPFKEYKKDYPNWSIQPIKESEPTEYWKWVMATFNKEFAAHYGLEPADVPDEWNKIGMKRALESLRRTYMVH